jgi:hypothetical protein
MERFTRAPGYDLFKLLVAILLLVLFLLLRWRPAPQTAIPQSETPAFSPPAATGTQSSTPGAASATSSPQLALTSITPTEAANSLSTATGTNTPPPTVAASDIPAPIPTPTNTPAIESTGTPIAGVASTVDVCEAATTRSRVQTGRNATILRRLNFRSSAGIRDNWLLTNIPGTKVEVVGGPECTPHHTGAYLWWQIRLPDGRIGWSAEASLHGSFYFMEPVE